VRIRSISADAYQQAFVVSCSEAVATLFREAGIDDIKLLRAPRPDGSPGAPAVVACKPAPPGAPTVMLYAHYDVQPPGEGWDTDPFTPTVINGRMYGRGSADDKVGIIAHLGALRALTAVGLFPDVGLTVFIEGEEEVGSPSFSNFLNKYRDNLQADVIVVADSANWAVGTPALTTSLRGVVEGSIDIDVLDHSVHAGLFGGPLIDAYTVACRLIATMHDADGTVAIDGLVTSPEPAIDYDQAKFRAEAGVLPDTQLAGTGSISGRLWAKPSLAVLGIDATPTEQVAGILTPHTRLTLQVRLAPGQSPAAASQAVAAHLAKHAPFGAKVTWTPKENGRGWAADSDSVGMAAARSAFAAAWGKDPVDIGIGGSIPFIADLLDAFPAASILVTGVEDPDSRAHGANESVDLGDLKNAVLAEALLLIQVAGTRKAGQTEQAELT
jgi:acetylornithine deacetylase/succinyl-diaminopimelate desuccinylase-like protein